MKVFRQLRFRDDNETGKIEFCITADGDVKILISNSPLEKTKEWLEQRTKHPDCIADIWY